MNRFRIFYENDEWSSPYCLKVRVPYKNCFRKLKFSWVYTNISISDTEIKNFNTPQEVLTYCIEKFYKYRKETLLIRYLQKNRK